MSVYDYKRLCNRLRKHIDVVEQKMSANKWDCISSPCVPSRAMMNYRNAFSRHDEARFLEYKQQLRFGQTKIHAATLYPYDIIEKILYQNPRISLSTYSPIAMDFQTDSPMHSQTDNTILEEQWKQLQSDWQYTLRNATKVHTITCS